MDDSLALLLIYLVFAGISFGVYKLLGNSKMLVALISAWAYLIGIYFYFELINKLHQYLRDSEMMNIDFGHASIGLVLLMFFCYVNAIGLIIFSIYKRNKTNYSN